MTRRGGGGPLNHWAVDDNGRFNLEQDRYQPVRCNCTISTVSIHAALPIASRVAVYLFPLLFFVQAIGTETGAWQHNVLPIYCVGPTHVCTYLPT